MRPFGAGLPGLDHRSRGTWAAIGLLHIHSGISMSEEAVRADLAQAKRQGYAVCADELDPGILGYACLVHIEASGSCTASAW